jgi:hypothetical protein
MAEGRKMEKDTVPNWLITQGVHPKGSSPNGSGMPPRGSPWTSTLPLLPWRQESALRAFDEAFSSA